MFIHSSILHLSAKLMFNLQHDIEPLTAKSPTCCCLTLPLLERGAIGLSSSSNEVLQSSKPKGNACLHMIHVTASALLPVYSLENEKKKKQIKCICQYICQRYISSNDNYLFKVIFNSWSTSIKFKWVSMTSLRMKFEFFALEKKTRPEKLIFCSVVCFSDIEY